ncbi:hypothetical protein CKAH01_07765 [Colletotrichum kahawae]|uniref:Uncharacterized protein n=1 Tax=Colletotrichum kahawae TaxID=34407 RepID=A0AAD9Y4U6_COLKA|nr:hypothetical protein CKAH01_07765 [Colletotrichum kahawae]
MKPIKLLIRAVEDEETFLDVIFRVVMDLAAQRDTWLKMSFPKHPEDAHRNITATIDTARRRFGDVAILTNSGKSDFRRRQDAQNEDQDTGMSQFGSGLTARSQAPGIRGDHQGQEQEGSATSGSLQSRACLILWLKRS